MRLRPASGIVLALGLLAGCGGSDDVSAEPPSGSASSAQSPGAALATETPVVIEDPAAAAAATAVTREYLDAFLAGRAARFCALQTPRFTAEGVRNAITFEVIEKGAGCVELVSTVIRTSREADPNPGTKPTYETTALEASPTQAAIRVAYPDTPGATPQVYRLVKRAGSWLVDAQERSGG